jgi:hypothetical protein
MSWKFYGHAAVFGVPDTVGDIICPGAFTEFLSTEGHLEIPILNGHEQNQAVGKLLHIHQDAFGLFIVGELVAPLPPPYAGLSIGPTNSQGSPYPNAYGGKLIRVCHLNEISIVITPTNPVCRILGPWEAKI